ncbi:hypothetical protein ACHAWX_004505, partial [Stephanocyclus meneghinianus]
SSYVIVKRRNQIFFIPASPTTRFLDVKNEICKAMNNCGCASEISSRLIRLYLVNDDSTGGGEEGTLLPDAATLADHEVKNADVLYVTFPKGWEEGGAKVGGDWETLASVRRRDT